jgi:hypothetical protein
MLLAIIGSAAVADGIALGGEEVAHGHPDGAVVVFDEHPRSGDLGAPRCGLQIGTSS